MNKMHGMGTLRGGRLRERECVYVCVQLTLRQQFHTPSRD